MTCSIAGNREYVAVLATGEGKDGVEFLIPTHFTKTHASLGITPLGMIEL